MATPLGAQDAARPEPYRRGGGEPLDYRGPGREAKSPLAAEVRLGWFGPGDPEHAEFGDYWRGASLALEQENAAGGHGQRPLRLVPVWSESPWQAAAADLARLVYEGDLLAVIGGVDGATTHLALQLALKSRFLLLSPGSTDATADHANVPWLFSLPPSSEALAPVIATAAAAAARGGRLALVAGTDHDSHAMLVAVRRALSARRLAPAVLVELSPADPALPSAAARLAAAGPAAVVVLASPTLGGGIVAELRRAGWLGAIVGGPAAGLAAFRRAAGEAAEGVIAPRWVDTAAPSWAPFAAAYERRWGAPPDAAAAHGHDAVRLAAAAVRSAGLNRALVRDAARALAPWPGAGGVVRWNALGRNQPAVSLGTWRGQMLE